MGFVQYFVTVLLSSAALVLTSPTRTQRSIGEQTFCPPGKYLSGDDECEQCPVGSYTSEVNCETDCHLCFRDCFTTNHLKVIQNCTNTADLKCACEPGFKCTDRVPHSDNCRECEKIRDTPVTISEKMMTTPPSSVQTKACVPPKCGPESVRTTLPPTHPDSFTAAYSVAAGFLVFLLLVILIFICYSCDEICFRQTIAKLCNQEGQNASQKTKEPPHQFPRNSSSPSAANLGSVHVHNPGTVIFSLLSQFTGQVGPTVQGGKTAETADSREEDERDCPVFHPASSSSVHMSEEERSWEADNVFFPLQEQGKDCHVSKEEVV